MIDINEKIFDFAYDSALFDAVNQKAYVSSNIGKKVLWNNFDARDTVKTYIDDIINGTNPDFYLIEKKVEDSFSSFLRREKISGDFTFGNTQKLINMTVKNMYRVVYVAPDLRINFSGCHCPMDNIIIDSVKKNIDKVITEGYRLPEDIVRIVSNKGWKGQLSKPWSKITSGDIEQYKNFQIIIKYLSELNSILPIEYDYYFWQ